MAFVVKKFFRVGFGGRGGGKIYLPLVEFHLNTALLVFGHFTNVVCALLCKLQLTCFVMILEKYYHYFNDNSTRTIGSKFDVSFSVFDRLFGSAVLE